MTDAAPPAETPNGDPSQQGQPAGPGFRILAQYVRDFSFENPRAPESLRIDGKPAIDLGVEMAAQGRPDGLFELDLKLSDAPCVVLGVEVRLEQVLLNLVQNAIQAMGRVGQPRLTITTRILDLYWQRQEDDALNTPVRYDD